MENKTCATCKFEEAISHDNCDMCLDNDAAPGYRTRLPKEQQDDINSPSHYTSGGIEVLDYIKAKLTNEQLEGYCIGNVIKYISRYRHKNGVEDLKKARWYLEKAIKEREGDGND